MKRHFCLDFTTRCGRVWVTGEPPDIVEPSAVPDLRDKKEKMANMRYMLELLRLLPPRIGNGDDPIIFQNTPSDIEDF